MVEQASRSGPHVISSPKWHAGSVAVCSVGRGGLGQRSVGEGAPPGHSVPTTAEWWFSNLRGHQNHLEGLLKHRLMWSIHTMKQSTIQRNLVPIHDTMWMNPEGKLLSEGSQTRKATHCMIPFV